MRGRLTVALLAALGGCSLIDDAKNACKQLVDQEIGQAWDQCTSYYQGTVLPELQQGIAAAEQRIKADCEAACTTSCEQQWLDSGCTPV